MATWNDLCGRIPDCTLGHLMDSVEEDTGKFPEWEDPIPSWVEDLVGTC